MNNITTPLCNSKNGSNCKSDNCQIPCRSLDGLGISIGASSDFVSVSDWDSEFDSILASIFSVVCVSEEDRLQNMMKHKSV